MNYLKFEVEDFVMDESFQEWVKGADSSTNKFWENWIKQNPQKKDAIEKAREVLLNLEFKESQVENVTVDREWDELVSLLNLGSENTRTRQITPIFGWKKMAAAAIFLLTSSMGIFFYNLSKYSIIKTDFAQTKTITLPDNSKVTLNGNSRIKYLKDWSEVSERNVTLTGEAFFSVTHKSDNQKFVVTTEDLDVIVVGTEFDVNTRRGKTKVVLSSGKVNLKDSENEKIEMTPGEMVVYSGDKYVVNEVQPEVYTAWKHNRLEFKNTSIGEIAELLEDNYGYRVIIKDQTIAKRRLTGTYPANNIEILIKAITGIFNLNITKKQNELIFESRK